jgi:hypothetical protein
MRHKPRATTRARRERAQRRRDAVAPRSEAKVLFVSGDGATIAV